MVRWPAYLVIVGALAAIQGAILHKAADAQVPPAAAPAALPAGDEEAGREAYVEDCRACHSGAIAPALKGVAGRAIASAPGYAYSDALKAKSAETWTPANLDAFLSNPAAFAPGTKMVKKVEEPQKRADIIAYLQSLSE